MNGPAYALELEALAYDLPADDPLLAGFIEWGAWTAKMIGDANFARLVFGVFAYDADDQAVLRDRLVENYRKTYQRTLRQEIMKLGCAPGRIALNDLGETAWLQREAERWSSGITNTYNRWLSGTIDKALQTWRDAHGGSLKGLNRATLASRIRPEVNKYWRGYRLPKAEGGWRYGRNHMIAVTEEGRANARAFMQFYRKSAIPGAEVRVTPSWAVCDRCAALIAMGWVPVSQMQFDLPLHPRCIHSYESRMAPGTQIDCSSLWRGAASGLEPGA